MRHTAAVLLWISLFSFHTLLQAACTASSSSEYHEQHHEQSQRDLATLAEKWNLTDNGFEYEALSFNLGYLMSDFVLDSMIVAEMYDENCKEGGVPVPSDELSYTLITDDTEPGVGDNPRNVSVKVDVNSAKITDSITYNEGTTGGELQATIKFCMRMGLFTNSEPAIEVNFLETIVTLYVDLTDGFSIDNISVTPRDQLVQTANQEYQVEGFLCDYNNIELSDTEKVQARNQGSILRVCVRPDAEARSDEVYMRYIDSFTWQRDYGGNIGSLTQEAVVDREAANNGLTELYCVSGSEVCAFETILFAAMFRTPGAVSGAGIASMQFGTDQMTSKRRKLRQSSRALQEDDDENVAAQAEFDLDMEVVPVKNPYLNYGDSSTSSRILVPLKILVTFWALILTSFVF